MNDLLIKEITINGHYYQMVTYNQALEIGATVEDLNIFVNEFNNKEIKSRLMRLRNGKTQKIRVNINNITLDGDEKSQERISRAINALEPQETTYWIDASGEPQELTREDLKEALKLAGQKQTEIFVEYAQKKAELQV